MAKVPPFYDTDGRGTNISKSLSLSARRPRKLFSKVFAAASSASHIRHVVLGDSLANVKMQQIAAALDRRVGGFNSATTNTNGNLAGAGNCSGGQDYMPNAATLYAVETGLYQYWPTGRTHKLAAGGSCSWTLGGGSPYFTDVKVYYIKEPGAGTINLVVGGATVATASANAAVGLGVLTYTKTVGTASVATTVTGADVRIVLVHGRNTTQSGVDQYANMSIDGLLLANATSSAQGRAIWQAVIADIVPDLITFEMDDNFGDAGANDGAIDYVVMMLDAACPYADKVIIGSTPRAADDAGKITAHNYLKNLCGSKNASWLFFDSYYLMGSYAEMVAIFGADDGVHPAAAAEAYAAEILWEFLGLNGFNLGYVPRAVNDRGTPSRFARGTNFGSATGSLLTVNTDASFGYDWTIAFPRTLTFTNDSGTACWQFSNNTVVNANVIPLTLDFNTQGNVRKIDTNGSSGYEFTRWRKTDNPNGLMNVQTGLILSNFTRAQLLAIGANQVVGAFAFCTDCTGGAQLAYARGTSPTDWVTVDGKTAI